MWSWSSMNSSRSAKNEIIVLAVVRHGQSSSWVTCPPTLHEQLGSITVWLVSHLVGKTLSMFNQSTSQPMEKRNRTGKAYLPSMVNLWSDHRLLNAPRPPPPPPSSVILEELVVSPQSGDWQSWTLWSANWWRRESEQGKCAFRPGTSVDPISAFSVPHPYTLPPSTPLSLPPLSLKSWSPSTVGVTGSPKPSLWSNSQTMEKRKRTEQRKRASISVFSVPHPYSLPLSPSLHYPWRAGRSSTVGWLQAVLNPFCDQTGNQPTDGEGKENRENALSVHGQAPIWSPPLLCHANNPWRAGRSELP